MQSLNASRTYSSADTHFADTHFADTHLADTRLGTHSGSNDIALSQKASCYLNSRRMRAGAARLICGRMSGRLAREGSVA